MRKLPLRFLPLLLLLPTAAVVADDASRIERRRTPVVDVFEATRDAVVSISSTEIIMVRSRSPLDSVFDDFFDMPRSRVRQQKRESVGSGFVIHEDGYIVTNAHVIARTAEQRVIFADGREFDARVVAADAGLDLAVLKVDSDRPLPTLPLGRSDDLLVGETVIAIGNPLGFQHTVTSGVVSATNREIQVSAEISFTGLIQTDASINPGNSGGPLLNVLGELIGINSAIRGDAQNIGFAIPVDQLREVLPDLLDVERRYRIQTGLVIDHLHEPRVLDVVQPSTAAEAGIRPGDVLRAIDGQPIREGIDFDIALINRGPDQTVQLELVRDGGRYVTDLRLASRPLPDGAALAQRRLGLTVRPLPEDVAREIGLRQPQGLLIERVEPGGPGDAAGIRKYDVLLAIGRHYVPTLNELGQLLEVIEPGAGAAIRVLRIERRGKMQRSGPIRVR